MKIKEAELAVTEATEVGARLAATANLKGLEDELASLQKREAVLQGKDPAKLFSTEREQIALINERVIATAGAIEVYEQSNDALDAEESRGKVSASRLKEINALRDENNINIRRSTKDLEAHNKELDKLVKTKPTKDVIALIQNTTTETKSMTAAALEFYKLGDITAGDFAAPVREIGDSIAVVQKKIENLAASPGVQGAFDGLLASTAESNDLLLSNAKIYDKIAETRDKATGGTQKELDAANQIINAGKAIIEQNDIAIARANQQLKIDNARITAREKLARFSRDSANQAVKQYYADEKQKIAAFDKVALAKLKYQEAKAELAVAENTVITDKKGVVTATSKLALDKARTKEREAFANIKITKDTVGEAQLKFFTKQEEAADKRISSLQKQTTALGYMTDLERQQLAITNEKATVQENLLVQEAAILEAKRLTKIDDEQKLKLLELNSEELRTQMELLDKQAARLNVNHQIMTQTVDLLGNQLGSALVDAGMGIDSWKDAAEGFRRGLIQIAIQLLVIQPLIESIKATMDATGPGGAGGGIASTIGAIFASADGNVYSGGAPDKRYATGGIVTRPTMFPQTDGNTGLMGEAGPEAILPLTRINGDLGVKTQISGEIGTGSTEITIINESGMPMGLTETSRKTDDKGKEFVTLLMTSLNYNPDVRKAIKNL